MFKCTCSKLCKEGWMWEAVDALHGYQRYRLNEWLTSDECCLREAAKAFMRCKYECCN